MHRQETVECLKKFNARRKLKVGRAGGSWDGFPRSAIFRPHHGAGLLATSPDSTRVFPFPPTPFLLLLAALLRSLFYPPPRTYALASFLSS